MMAINDFSPLLYRRFFIYVVFILLVVVPLCFPGDIIPPQIAVNRANLNFGAVKNGMTTSTMTGPQTLLISNSGGGTLDWYVMANTDWLILMPMSGSGNGAVTVSVAPCGLAAGTYSGTIWVIDANASNSPKTIPVELDVKNPAGQSSARRD